MEGLNQEGFFEVTSNVNWCEPDYYWTYFIAEFWNCISSLVMTAMAVGGILNTLSYRGDTRFIVNNIFFAIVGLGSAAFHGTLSREGQVLDELPMLYGILCGLYCSWEDRAQRQYPFLPVLLALFGGLITWLYFLFPGTPIPQHLAFLAGILVLTVRAHRVRLYVMRGDRHVTFLLRMALVAYLAAGVCWITDKLLCDYVVALYLHSWWHILAGFGSYSFACYLEYYRGHVLGRSPKVRYYLGFYPVPYCKKHQQMII